MTAFSLGHALTLAATVTHVITLSSRAQSFVEIGVAASIVIAAAHAALFDCVVGSDEGGKQSQKTPLLAGFFGLLHGLAFAGALGALGYRTGETAIGLVAFHLGAETTQLLVVALCFPWFLRLLHGANAPSKTTDKRVEPFRYRLFRRGIALVAGLVACGWIGERAFAWTNPFTPLAAGAVEHPIVAVLALAALTTGMARVSARLEEGKTRDHESARDLPKERLAKNSI